MGRLLFFVFEVYFSFVILRTKVDYDAHMCATKNCSAVSVARAMIVYVMKLVSYVTVCLRHKNNYGLELCYVLPTQYFYKCPLRSQTIRYVLDRPFL